MPDTLAPPGLGGFWIAAGYSLPIWQWGQNTISPTLLCGGTIWCMRKLGDCSLRQKQTMEKCHKPHLYGNIFGWLGPSQQGIQHSIGAELWTAAVAGMISDPFLGLLLKNSVVESKFATADCPNFLSLLSKLGWGVLPRHKSKAEGHGSVYNLFDLPLSPYWTASSNPPTGPDNALLECWNYLAQF